MSKFGLGVASGVVAGTFVGFVFGYMHCSKTILEIIPECFEEARKKVFYRPVYSDKSKYVRINNTSYNGGENDDTNNS